jgi:hypothetical protein
MDSNDLAHLEELGYEGVLAEMAKGEGRLGRPGSQVREEIEHWLKLKEEQRSSVSAAKRDAREEETLSIARKASRRSMWANIIALTAAIVAAKDQILSAISWLTGHA